MPLPHFGKPLTSSPEPIYRNLFEVVITSTDISEKETINISENVKKIERNIIGVYGNNKIIKTLLKIKGFDLLVKGLDRYGDIHLFYLYKNCLFKNLELCFLNFDYESDETMIYDIEFEYDDFEFYDDIKQYERMMKLNRILD